MENHGQEGKHKGPQPLEGPSPLRLKDKPRKTKEPQPFEDHCKPKKRTRAQAHGRINEINVWAGRDQAGERDQRKKRMQETQGESKAKHQKGTMTP